MDLSWQMETSVKIKDIKKMVVALINKGLKINMMSTEVYHNCLLSINTNMGGRFALQLWATQRATWSLPKSKK